MTRRLVCLASLLLLLSGCVIVNSESHVTGTQVEAEPMEASTAPSSPAGVYQARGNVVADCWTD